MKIKGFPTEIKDVEVPNLGELLNMQFTHLCHLDDFYKNGCDYQRYLVDQLELVGKISNVGVTFHVQYLYPGVIALPDRSGHAEEWHADYDLFGKGVEGVKSHLLLSNCECLTVFNEESFELDVDSLNLTDSTQVNDYLSNNSYLLTPKAMPSDKLVSFDSHVHKVVMPTKPQLRFMFRVTENPHPAQRWEDAILNQGRVGRGTEYVGTVKKSPGKIFLDMGWHSEEYYKNYDRKTSN